MKTVSENFIFFYENYFYKQKSETVTNIFIVYLLSLAKIFTAIQILCSAVVFASNAIIAIR